MKPSFYPITKGRYEEMRETMSPVSSTDVGFLVDGECIPQKCAVSGETLPAYRALAKVSTLYFEADAPMTVPEFTALGYFDVVPKTPSVEPVIQIDEGAEHQLNLTMIYAVFPLVQHFKMRSR